MGKIYEHLENKDNDITDALKQKDEEINFLNNKLLEFESTIKKYSENLKLNKISYDKSITEFKKALNKRNEELRSMKEHYEKVVKDVNIVYPSFSIKSRI
jgi:hypothetical protein